MLYDYPSALFYVEHLTHILRSRFEFFTQIREDLGMGSGGQLGRNVDRLVVFGDNHVSLLLGFWHVVSWKGPDDC